MMTISTKTSDFYTIKDMAAPSSAQPLREIFNVKRVGEMGMREAPALADLHRDCRVYRKHQIGINLCQQRQDHVARKHHDGTKKS